MGWMAHIKLIKLFGDFFHIFSFLPLFLVLRISRKTAQGISMHSQDLFAMALLLRYASTLMDTSETVKTVEWFTPKVQSASIDLDMFVSMYKRASSNAIYVYLLRAIPMCFAVSAALKIRYSPSQWDARDGMRSQYLFAPCLIAAFLLHHTDFMGRGKARDLIAMCKTASYFIESVAILPQLYLQNAPGGARGGPDDGKFSFALDLHLVTRGLWRGAYVVGFLIKTMEKGRGLQGSFADNLQHLSGILQMLIYFELFAGFLRRRFRSTVLALGTLGLLWSRGGAPQLEAVLIKGMCASVVGSLVLGGFMTLNICSAFAIVQCYRAGIMTFRNPIELINRVRGKRSDDQEEL